MSYAIELGVALVRVLKHACDGSEEYFAGFAANRDFWIGEARHCLDVINGYDERFEKMKRAPRELVTHKCDWPTIPITKRSTRAEDLVAMRRTILEEMRRYLRRCAKLYPQLSGEITREAKTLGVSTPL